MTDDIGGFSIGFGRFRLGATGTVGTILLMLGLVVGANAWGAYLVQQELRYSIAEQTRLIFREIDRRGREHTEMQAALNGIERTQDRTACVLTMTPAERSVFRQSRQSFSSWCSWVRE